MTVQSRQSAATCRWAVATVSLPAPTWLEAESSPWTCTREKDPKVLDSTERCADCPQWRPVNAA